jgi:branched-chain amino acid transport system ATP-binding protein
MKIAPALECVGVHAGYNKVAVARNIDLSVGHKQILTVLGPNGAGKTTLLLTIAGFLAPLEGVVRIDGEQLRSGSARRMNKAGIVLVPDSRALFTELTPVQNLKLATQRSRGSVDDVMDLFPALRLRSRLRVGQLSGGEQQMLAVARALIQAPKVLLIDEMSMGLAPVIVESLLPIIRRVADESDAAVVLVEQHIQLALEVADLAAVLVHGEVIAAGTADEVRQQEADLERAYFSGEATIDPGPTT